MLQNNEQSNLMQVQIELEETMRERGEQRHFRAINKAKASQTENHTVYGTGLISGYIKDLANAIDAFKAEASSGRAGAKNTAVRFIGNNIGSEQVAFITLKHIVAGISSEQALSSLAFSIGEALEDELRLSEIRSQEKRVYDSIIKGVMKRGSQHYKHAYLIRRADYFNDGWVSWGTQNRILVGSKLIDTVISSLDLIERHLQGTGKSQRAIITAKPSTVKWLEDKKMAGLRSPYEPMVVKPKDWETPYGGGYITSNIKPLSLVKRVTKDRLKALYENAKMPKVYQTVNALQHTEWQINNDVLNVMNNLWESGSTLGGIPSKADLELPPKPLDMNDAEAFKQWKRDASAAHRNHIEATSARIAFSMTIDVATRFSSFKRIFMPYQVDFRGRIYAVPQLNPQGSDFQKGLLRFSQGKPLGDQGVKWLAIHGANVAGVDKVSFQERVNWVEDNEEEICAIANNPYDNKGWASAVAGVEIDKPWQFLAFCFEWAGYCQQGEKFISHLPIALDGSCSGIQHFSAMLRDAIGGAAVNLIPQEKPADVYQLVADKVIEKVNDDLINGTEDGLSESGILVHGTKSLASQWLEFGITRKTCKRAVMTTPYGSREYGFKEQLLEDILRPAEKAMGEDFPFADNGFGAANYMAKKIWQSVTVTLVAAGQAMDWVKSVGSVANKAKESIRWTTPAGFVVEQSYKNLKSVRVETHIGGDIRMRCDIPLNTLDMRKQSSALSPNWIHSLDASHLMMTVCEAEGSGINSFAMIHDSFGTHAADTDALFAIVRDTFVDMYEHNDVLAQFKQAVATTITDETLLEELPDDLIQGDLDLEDVKFSMYCFA